MTARFLNEGATAAGVGLRLECGRAICLERMLVSRCTRSLCALPPPRGLLSFRCLSSAASGSAMSESEQTKRLRLEEPPLIGTHSGTFHADEALAVYLLRTLPEYRNARKQCKSQRALSQSEGADPQVWCGRGIQRCWRRATLSSTCVASSWALVRSHSWTQVGGEYLPDKERYDHHQRGFNEVYSPDHKTKLSSAGLIYKWVARRLRGAGEPFCSLSIFSTQALRTKDRGSASRRRPAQSSSADPCPQDVRRVRRSHRRHRQCASRRDCQRIR